MRSLRPQLQNSLEVSLSDRDRQVGTPGRRPVTAVRGTRHRAQDTKWKYERLTSTYTNSTQLGLHWYNCLLFLAQTRSGLGLYLALISTPQQLVSSPPASATTGRPAKAANAPRALCWRYGYTNPRYYLIIHGFCSCSTRPAARESPRSHPLRRPLLSFWKLQTDCTRPFSPVFRSILNLSARWPGSYMSTACWIFRNPKSTLAIFPPDPVLVARRSPAHRSYPTFDDPSQPWAARPVIACALPG